MGRGGRRGSGQPHTQPEARQTLSWRTAAATTTRNTERGGTTTDEDDNGGDDEEQREKEETIDEAGETVANDRASSTSVMDPDVGLDDCAHMPASSR